MLKLSDIARVVLGGMSGFGLLLCPLVAMAGEPSGPAGVVIDVTGDTCLIRLKSCELIGVGQKIPYGAKLRVRQGTVTYLALETRTLYELPVGDYQFPERGDSQEVHRPRSDQAGQREEKATAVSPTRDLMELLVPAPPAP